MLTVFLVFCRDSGIIDGFNWTGDRVTILRGRYSFQLSEREAIPFLRGFLKYEAALGRWLA